MTQDSAERTADGNDAEGTPPPSWLRFLALGAAAGVLAFGSVGLLLAVNGWYRPGVAFPIGAVVWIAVLVLARPVLVSKRPASRGAHVYAAIGVAAILAITAWNAAHASQHVLINRDGGSYANTARWIARDGSLAVKPRVGAFANAPGVGYDSFAVYQMKDGTLQFQFAHLLPVVMAEAFAIKGDAGLFHAPEVLGGIALLAFYLLAWRLFRRPLFALSATLALAFIIPQVSFSRDSYSEIPSQILLFTAMWLLVSTPLLTNWRIALTSGLFLGALESTRIDAIVFLIGVPVLLLVAWLGAGREHRRRVQLPAICAFVAGIVPGMALGLIDLTRHSGLYYRDLSHDVKLLAVGVVVSALTCGVVLALAQSARLVDVFRSLPWRALATTAAVSAGAVGFFAWWVRPRIQHLHGSAIGLVGGLQAAEHVAVDPTRTYFEQSMNWMSWYLGPLTLAAAVIGGALLVRELLLGRMARTLGVLAVLAPGSVLYLYKAKAVPDHVWVTRRFLVSAFPLLILLALGLAAAVAGPALRARFGAVPRVGAVVFAVLAIAYPIYTVRNVSSMSEKRGFLAIVHDACDDMGPHAAVVVLERDVTDLFDDWIPQAFRSWCGADVAITRGPAKPESLRSLARAWNAQGRRLFVVALTADAIAKVLPDATIMSTPVAVDAKALQQSLTHRPDAYARETIFMSVAQVPTG